MHGLSMFMAMLRARKPLKTCERCHLQYEIDRSDCPHCHHLTNDELAKLRGTLQSRREVHDRLGCAMLIGAGLMILALMGVVFLARA
jgi:hypothetical protein